jgi:hypothetical protein
VRDLRYSGDLTIAIQGPGFSFAHVVFRQPIGFRVLDEADLTEYWNTYSEPRGWLWEVERGGWLELKRDRPFLLEGQAGRYPRIFPRRRQARQCHDLRSAGDHRPRHRPEAGQGLRPLADRKRAPATRLGERDVRTASSPSAGGGLIE